jgi:hypothetical protein
MLTISHNSALDAVRFHRYAWRRFPSVLCGSRGSFLRTYEKYGLLSSLRLASAFRRIGRWHSGVPLCQIWRLVGVSRRTASWCSASVFQLRVQSVPKLTSTNYGATRRCREYWRRDDRRRFPSDVSNGNRRLTSANKASFWGVAEIDVEEIDVEEIGVSTLGVGFPTPCPAASRDPTFRNVTSCSA